MARNYDLFVYHDFTDTIHDQPPAIGQEAGAWLGDAYKDLYVTAVGPGIHEGRTTVVLAHEWRPDRQQEIKRFFAAGSEGEPN